MLDRAIAPDWHGLAADLQADGRLLIDGDWRDASEGETFTSTNPTDGSVICDVASATPADVNRAVAVARERFDGGVWSKMHPRDRNKILMRFADLIGQLSATFALLDTLEMGKPISEMLSIDVPGSILTVRFMAECIDKVGGACPTNAPGALHYIQRQPLGVVGCITPWNYPMMMACWKVAPALAAGNSVVLKPAEDASLSALLLGRLFLEAGGPAGVFNVVPGVGATAGKTLASSMQVDRIAFTGSTGVGRLMYDYASKSNLKRVDAELGGKSPQIILNDARDLQKAAAVVARGIFGNQGEVCSAGSRILVQNEIHDQFCDLLKKEAEAFVPGDPLDPGTTMGPLVNRAHQTKVLSMIDNAAAEGASAFVQGDADVSSPDGCFVSPTLFRNVTNDMTIAQQEVFGPVGAVIAHDGIEHAIRLANDSPYGLAAGVWTQNLTSAHTIASELQCGMVWINGYMNGDMTQPWGGWKESGHGRDKSMDALLENSQTKSVWVTLDG
ncbi:aldehyde dehydrogenase family protein [uncultured Hoeflea sp.]|uniref:aldehyde dehydrogenase family protein n=1 Tax=uncultured Hoeflea sp. TaxID=538666 RepID=UPI002612807C|nr:aldehyde dehydrogenase family protein [uncultured Hoeflea sp.]